jgi:anthranilate synthase component 1
VEFTSKEELRAKSGGFDLVPLSLVLDAQRKTPVDAFRILKNLSRQCFILESLEDPEHRGRYTFLGYDPKMEISCVNGEMKIKSGAEIVIKTDDPGASIKSVLETNRSPKLDGLPPFAGGLVGYFSYDFIKYSEPALNLDAEDQEGFKDVDLMLFDKAVVFDHLKKAIILLANVRTDAFDENYNRAAGELSYLAGVLESGEPADIKPLRLKSQFRALFSKSQYCSMVEKAKFHIHEGDVFQAVLSNRLEAEADGSLFDAYRKLRQSNPSPYMFYFSSDDLEIAGASPETLVKLKDGRVRTFPLAGTRPRGKSLVEDESMERELLSDEKELAEHNMLVDLGRNDIGKISRFSSVTVDRYMSVERFSHVMHIGSEVSGTLLPGKSAIDAIDAVLPAGTLSGAPKIRACQIINSLENNKRGIYGGAIGYISFTGDMDSCIAIRIAYKKNGKVFVRSGAGIVAESVPEKEYKECADKMRAVLDALRDSEGGLSE